MRPRSARPADLLWLVQDFPANRERAEEFVIRPLLSSGKRVVCHGGEHPGTEARCVPGRPYRYEENVRKFCDCVTAASEFLTDDTTAIVFIEHDCYVHSMDRLDALLMDVHDEFPCAWGNVYDYPYHHWFMALPYIREQWYLVGAFFVLNRKAFQQLAEFVAQHAEEIAEWQASCDFFLASFLQRDRIAVRSLNRLVHCSHTGMCRRLDLWSGDVALYHKVDDHVARSIGIHRRLAELPVNVLDGEAHLLTTAAFAASSAYRAPGTAGRMFSDSDIPVFVEHGIDTSSAVGFHAPSLMALRTWSESPYVLAGACALNATAGQAVDFYLYLNGARALDVTVELRQIVPFSLLCPAGPNTIVIESEPTKKEQHEAHSCLVNPTFARIDGTTAMREALRAEHPLKLWRR